jgi:large subunit ribosomal protein L10
VVKNTLAKIAAAQVGVEGLDELLQGPTAIAYVHGDAVKVAKTIQDFIKEKKKASIRGGKLQRSVLNATDIEALAACRVANSSLRERSAPSPARCTVLRTS